MHVLVVEDEVDIANYLKRGLEEQGYAVDQAFDGRDALDWAEAVPFDLIVLDILLPELDGLAVCRAIRARGLSTPILMLTARDAIDDRVAGLDAGADDYLVKPFALRELLARLRALVRRPTDPGWTSTLQVADLVLDTESHSVKRAGQAIQLTAREYAILECLLRRRGRALTRTTIADHVWSYDAYNASNVLDVHIRNLRRKIDDPYSLKLIHTVRGSGYRLSVDEDEET